MKTDSIVLAVGTFFLSVIVAIGCSKKADDTSDASTTDGTATPAASATASASATPPTDGSQSMADLAGYGYYCELLTSGEGTSLDGKAFVRYLRLYADGTYSFATDLTEATACAYGSASGTGYNTVTAQYNISGTYTIGGTAGTPSTATKITFTPTSELFTIYNPQTVATALNIATWADTHCGSWGSSFSTTSSSSHSFAPTSCTATSAVSLGTPPSLNSPQYNIGYRSTHFQMGTLSNLWSPDAGSFPNSYTTTWQ